MVKTRAQEKAEKRCQQDYLFARPSKDELSDLKKEFTSSKPIKLPRKIGRSRGPSYNNKVTLPMIKTIYQLRYNLGYSYDRISKVVHRAATTIHAALRRYERSEGQFIDRRKFNGTKNPRTKILPRVSKYLLDPVVL